LLMHNYFQYVELLLLLHKLCECPIVAKTPSPLYILQPFQITINTFRSTSNNIKWNISLTYSPKGCMEDKAMNSTK
jgi:hypothetical protein